MTRPCLASRRMPSETVDGFTAIRSAMAPTVMGASAHSVEDQIIFR
ncbi:hypothetical protein AHiyo4_44610 [Arthrobacter sp. Hiyo4]|nr:hypothetical protein AHiyo4_44610 [Arthrobacter sp. Hiyo4]